MVLDGNFSAQHKHMRNPEDDVALADGHAFMVTDAPYKEHLKTAAEFKEVGRHILTLSPLTDRTTPANRRVRATSIGRC